MAKRESRSDSSISADEEDEERWIPWAPAEGLPQAVYCEAFHDDYEGIRALLRSSDSKEGVYRILFDEVVGYRNVNESYRLRSLPDELKSSGTPFFRVEGSRWISWLCNESGGVLSPEEMEHYAVITPEDWIDVAVYAGAEPSVERLDE